MNPQQQYIAQVKEEYDELGIWVPVNEVQEPAESVAAAVPKIEPTDQTTTTHSKPKKSKKAKKVKRTEPLTKRERHVQRLETMNSLLRKDLREVRNGTTVQRIKDLENQVLLLQGPNKASIVKDLKLENLQLQKKVENMQREVKNAERDVRAYNNSIEYEYENGVPKGLGDKLAQLKAENHLVVRNLEKKLKQEHKNRKRVEDCWRKAEERLAHFTDLEAHRAEKTEESLNEEDSMDQNVIKDEESMESE